LENLWKTFGKPLENRWKTFGKPLENLWKTTKQNKPKPPSGLQHTITAGLQATIDRSLSQVSLKAARELSVQIAPNQSTQDTHRGHLPVPSTCEQSRALCQLLLQSPSLSVSLSLSLVTYQTIHAH